MSNLESLLREAFEIPRKIELFTRSVDDRELIDWLQYSSNPQNFEIYMKSFPAEERLAYQNKLSALVLAQFPYIAVEIRFIYYGVGEADWMESTRNWLEHYMKESFRSASYDSSSNILKVVITTQDLERHKVRNEEQVRWSIRSYIKTSILVIEHVPEMPKGTHNFLRYDEADDDWSVDLRVWAVLSQLEPIFQGAASWSGKEKIEVFVMSKNEKEQKEHEEIIAKALTQFGTREFIHFTHLPGTLQEYNSSIIHVQE